MKDKLYLLREEKIETALLKLGVPTMIGMLVSALYNIVDALFVGQLGTFPMAAVSVVFPVTMVATGVGLLFGSGAGSYMARLLGGNEYEKVDECATTAIVTGMIAAIIFIGSMLLFFEPLMKLLGATDNIMPYAKQFGMLFIGGLVFNVFSVMVNNMIASEGAAAYSMVAMISGGVLNMILEPVFIFTLHLGVRGAAIATLISRLVSTFLYVAYFFNGKSCIHFSFSSVKPSKSLYYEIFKVGLPLLIFQVLSSVSISLTNVAAKAYGESAIAAMGVVNRILSLESMAVFGFLKGFQPFVGYNFGAKQQERVSKAKKIALRWSTAFCVLYGIFCILFSKQLILIFNKQSAEVLMIGRKALILNAFSYMGLGLQIVFGSYFLAIGRAKEGGMLSICRQGAFFLPLICFLPIFLGINGLVLAQPLADILSIFLTVFMIKKEKANVIAVGTLS